METGLAGKRVLVTGGAGGIGSACVRAFAAEGARVAIHYRTSRDRAEELARETGGVALQADLTVETEVDGLFEAASGSSAASTSAPRSPASGRARTSRSGSSRSSAGRRRCARTSRRRSSLRAGSSASSSEPGHGSLVLVGSTAGRFGEAGHADYAAAKAALQVGLLLSLKNEIVRIAPRGRVNAVAPGWTYSPMTRGELDQEFVDRPQPDDGAAQGRASRRTSRAPSSSSPPTSSPATSRASS